MPDITMCASETCYARTLCRRNKASGTLPSDFRQSWFDPVPDGPCEYYWPILEPVK